jgi:hypothetical protein
MTFKEGCYIRTTVPPFITGQVILIYDDPLQYGICGIDENGKISAMIVEPHALERQSRLPQNRAFIGIDYCGRRVYDSSTWTGRKDPSYRR